MKKLFRVIVLFIDCWRYDRQLMIVKAENESKVKFLEGLICGELPKETLESEVRAILYKRKVEKEKWSDLIQIMEKQLITNSEVNNSPQGR